MELGHIYCVSRTVDSSLYVWLFVQDVATRFYLVGRLDVGVLAAHYSVVYIFSKFPMDRARDQYFYSERKNHKLYTNVRSYKACKILE